MPENTFSNKLLESANVNSSLRSSLTFWFLVVSIVPFVVAILFSMNYFEKNLTREFQKRLKKNHEGVEIEIEDMLTGLTELSKKNSEDEWIVSATLQKEIESLDAITLYLLKLESLDEIAVFDYEGNMLALNKNTVLRKIQKASFKFNNNIEKASLFTFLSPTSAKAAEDDFGFDIEGLDVEDLGEATEKKIEYKGKKLEKVLVEKIISSGALIVKSIDNDYGLRLDAYRVIKEIGIDRISGIVRSTLLVGERFCGKYKVKTGIDLMVISPDMIVSSLSNAVLHNVDFSDLYSNLKTNSHLMGESVINKIEYEYFLNPLTNDEGMMNAGMALFLSKEDFIEVLQEMKYTVSGVGFIVFVIVIIISLYISKLITDPVNTVLHKLKEISQGQGDLTERIVVNSTNEIGKLANWFNKFMGNLQEIVKSINGVSSSLNSSSHEMVAKTKKISWATSSQMESVESTLASIEEMNLSTKGIAEAVSELSNSAEKSSSAVLETDASVKELSNNSETLSSAVESAAMSISEMVASIKQVDNNAAVLKMITSDTQLSIKQIDESTSKIGDNASQTVRLSEQSIADASAGMSSVNETIKGINHIKDSVDRAGAVIETLGKKISSIDEILDVIDNVAEQTNLLALNAAIIAAQAGEHGKGFAIVADEIKDLADRTAASTKEIANIIIAVQKGSKNAMDVMKVSADNVTKSVNLSEDAGGMLEKILSNAEKSTARVKDIANSTVMQSSKSSEVMRSMVEVANMVNQISSATKEQSVGSNMILKATESIKDIAYQLKTAVREQTVASKDISTEIVNVSQMVKQINKAVNIQQEQSNSALTAIRKINDDAKENQQIIVELEKNVDSIEEKSGILNKEIGKFKV